LFVTSSQVSILRFDNKGGPPVDLLTFDKNNGGFKYDDQINSFQYGKDGVIPLQVLLDYQSNIYVRKSLFHNFPAEPVYFKFDIIRYGREIFN
jgi:hypothetical protein